jgi:hypothetical protein
MRFFLPTALAVLLSSLFIGCQNLDSAREQLTTTQTQLHDLQTQLHASTQPMPKEAVKAVDKTTAAVDKVVAVIPQNTDNPGSFVTAVAPLTGPAAPWVGLAGILLGWVWDRSKQAKALQTTKDGLAAAIKTKAITVTPAAAEVVNAAVTSHKTTDAIVDLLSDAASSPRIPQ